jgi:adenylate cyclase
MSQEGDWRIGRGERTSGLVEERRLATIMFTDMVGYTSLTQKNEELALRLLEEHRRILRSKFSRYGGNEIKTVGDAFLVEFSNTLDAVRCAYDIQEALHERNSSIPPEKRVSVRIGIHLGDILHSSGDLYGDAVNVASRIEPVADPGGICLSQQVYDQVWNKTEFQFEKIGPQELKNVRVPVELYKVRVPWEQGATPTEAGLSKGRIAILPFSNISPDPRDEYFAEGLTEELISSMSKVVGLRVVARTSVMKFKGTQKSIAEIARELKAGTILEGSVRKSGDRVRISVQLVDGETEEHLWSENYDREAQDVFGVQSEIAQKVTEALKVQLLAGERQRILSSPTKDPEAYNLYLRGRYHIYRDVPRGIRRAIQYFEEAIQKDPEFALAYAGLAVAHVTLVLFGHVSTRDGCTKARGFAMKALQLNPTLAEAHSALASVKNMLDWDFEGAEQEFKRAIELNPNLADAHMRYAGLLSLLKRYEEALAEAKLAQDLDPLSHSVSTLYGTLLYYQNRYDAAIVEFSKSLELDPTDVLAHNNLGMCYVMKSMFSEGIDEITRAFELDPENPFALADLAYAYSRWGKQEEELKILGQLTEMSQRGEQAMVPLAGVYSILGDSDHAFEWLEKAYAERSHYIRNIEFEFWFEGIRGDPRFSDLKKRIGLKS